ncbi:cytosine/adenosine deaminase-related metal-dependent hydrolase [Pseudonocardia cypriaca]|uniref:Cytosine/adenosine deaminase-related metal-dependent hydrolase n=2 Tax=Pseudonocardia cypriaca TaxID=882449 RepID=A0A543FSH9_9PSEU|nr:cytosine/adenosine deaminase-related metal-dependent hydrolase [Pseudonocardia cypriaca]
MKVLLRKLAHVATFDAEDRELRDADILVEGPRIAAIGEDLATDGVDRVIDGRGLLALPGLINAHQHLYQASMRTLPELERSGMPEFLAAQDALVARRWREGRFTADAVRATARAVLTESVLGGVTTVADQHTVFPGERPEPYVEATVEAAAEVGVRLHAGRGSVTFGRARGGMVDDLFAEPLDAVLAHAERLIADHHDPNRFAMTRVVLAPSGVVSDVPEIFREFADLAAGHPTVRLHTHLHHHEDTRFARARYGTSPWRILVDNGFAGPNVWVAHATTPPVEEISDYAAAGIGIAHIPAADLKLGWGLAPLRRYLDAGIPVGVGTTGSMTNDGAGLLGDLRVAALAHRALRTAPAEWPSARELLSAATRGSAACLGRDDLGSLAVGMAADIACWDLDSVDRAGVHDPVAALIFTGLSTRARLVLVNGGVVVEDGEPTRVDPRRAVREVRAILAADGVGTGRWRSGSDVRSSAQYAAA